MRLLLRLVVGMLAAFLGTASVLLLREGLSKPHSPGGHLLLIAAGATSLIVALGLAVGFFLMCPALEH